MFSALTLINLECVSRAATVVETASTDLRTCDWFKTLDSHSVIASST